MSKNIELDAPNIGALEKRHLAMAVDSGYVSTVGPLVPAFECKVAKYLGVRHAVSTQSGTAAIHMALYELGIKEGDEVIIPALTFAATVNPVKYVGAVPVFADIDPLTFNINPDDIEAKITRKTRAIMPVHLYGNPCDIDSIISIAKKHHLYVIEDATESLGATYRNKHTGTFGDFGCLSFNGNKTITTGGGGMIVGSNVKKIAHIKFLVNQAREDRNGYYHPEVGFNYRMTNIEAAIGLAQMERLDSFIKAKRDFNNIYRNELDGSSVIRFQEPYDLALSSWWLTCAIFDDSVDVAKLQKKLLAAGIKSRRIFIPLTELPPYRTARKMDFKNSRRIYERGLCLPSSTVNSRQDILHVCRVLRKIVT